MNSPATRFAPSPTGYLHAGHLLNAWRCWEWKAKTGGKVYLRFEDHDRQRSKPQYEEAILEDLAWLGFEPDPLPDGRPFLRQSDELERYQRGLEELEKHGLAYACDCTGKTLRQRVGSPGDGKELAYDGHCRSRKVNVEKCSWRLKLPEGNVAFHDQWLGPQTQNPARQCGDLKLTERNGNYTYQFCVVLDDWQLGITDIIRGEDLLASTGRQILMRRLFAAQGLIDSEAPDLRFWHHPLLVDAKGEKLSKRFFSESISSWRKKGLSPEEALEKAKSWSSGPSK